MYGGSRMTLRWRKSDIAFGVFVIVAVVALLVGLFLPSHAANRPDQPILPTPTSTITSNAIVRENALPGTGAWKIPSGSEATIQIQAYASATSASPGQTLIFYVSTQLEGTPYSIAVYRLGWYGSLGGRLEAWQANLVGHAQGYWDQSRHLLVGCHSCRIDTQTGLVEAKWQPSYKLTVPSDWVSGIYLAKFVDANNFQTYVPFDVRGSTNADYVVVTSDTTYAAYNNWGGYSLYPFNTASSDAENSGGSLSRASKVSFDRPYTEGDGSGHVLAFEADAIHWLEREGYDVSYISSADLHENPRQLLYHQAYISLGHDEYWTKEMRDGVEYARDHGVGLAFLGANASYWQMRFEPDSAGTRSE